MAAMVAGMMSQAVTLLTDWSPLIFLALGLPLALGLALWARDYFGG